MRTRHLLRVVCLPAAVLLIGCYVEQTTKRKDFFDDSHPWAVSAPTTVQAPGQPPRPVAAKPTEPEKAEPVQYKPDTEIVSPILEARGNWTLRMAFFNPNEKKKLSALHYANDFARNLIKKGYDAYVTDLISLAIVSIGSYDDPRDEELTKIWRMAYEEWLAIHGGRKSHFRQEMERFYGGKTVFGDQPWPVSIIDLQVKMKGAYKIPLTEEDKRRHKEYRDRQKARGTAH